MDKRPCHGCEDDRYVGCHSTCQKLKDWESRHDKDWQKPAVDRIVDDYMRVASARRRKRHYTYIQNTRI